MSTTRLAGLITAILGGSALALLFLDYVFVRIPTDVQRLGVIVRSLQNSDSPPEAVVFGNSVLMSGIDARAMSQRMAGEPSIWNLASTGQTLLEAYLLSQVLPDSVETAVFSIPIRAGTKEDPLHPQKYNTLFMYGYRPDSRTIESVQSLYPPETANLLARSELAQIFASRWAIRQLVDTQLRRLLRPDLALDTATFDLHHPQSYERRIDEDITNRFLAKRRREFDENPPALAEGTLQLSVRIVKEAEHSGRRAIFLFPPMHPDLSESFRDAMDSLVSDFRQAMRDRPNTSVVSTLRLLDDSQYIDDMHPTNGGAEMLSARLASAIDAIR